MVCGAGSSGAVVAARLAENPEVRVLLIEAGGDDDVPEVMTPEAWPANLGSERDWAFTAQPNPHLNGRAIPLNMGKVLGGGSSINVMVWARGHERLGALHAEPTTLGDVLDLSPHREFGAAILCARRGGPVYVKSAAAPHPVALAMAEAAQALGLPRFDSPNGEKAEEAWRSTI